MQAPVEDGKFNLLARAGRQVKVLILHRQHKPSMCRRLKFYFQQYTFTCRAAMLDHYKMLKDRVSEGRPGF